MRQIVLFLAAMLFSCCSADSEVKAQNMEKNMYITIDGQTQSATLVDNAATRELVAALRSAPITLTLDDNDFEIWGPLGISLTTKNERINTTAGDIVLYNGSNICIFYGDNSWSYTRLGRIDGLSGSELRTFLKAGRNNIKVTLSLTPGTTGISHLQPISQGEGENLTPNPSPKGDGNLNGVGEIYSLNGEKVSNPSKGIYIKNGKKIIL